MNAQQTMFDPEPPDTVEFDPPPAPPKKTRPDAKLGAAQLAMLDDLRAAGAYLRRQLHDGYTRSYLCREGKPLALGDKPVRYRNALVDSLERRGFLRRAEPDENMYSGKGGRWVLTDAGRAAQEGRAADA